MFKKSLSLILSLLIAVSVFTVSIMVDAASIPTLTFTESGITETVSGSGYSISGTALTITSGGTYKITGSCSEGSIAVAKSLSSVVLMLDDLTLTSSTTAPIVVKSSSSVTIHSDGTSTLTDAENPDDENSTDTAVADAFEGAAIKVKSGSSVTFCGDGTLNIDGSAVKNGIKGGATSSITFNGGTYNVTAANNGIAADGVLTFNAGTFTVDSDNDGIKSVPDSTDTDSSGSIFINGGTFDITVDGDGIQAETKLQINNGSFNITTLNGYNTTGTKLNSSSNGVFNADTMSCKGLKASGDRENIDNDIEINGGTFYLNTADDAIHSDVYAEIYGGTFTIYTGDDGVHADTSLTLGKEGSTYARNSDIKINQSYEGIEAGTIYVYQGRYYVVASDDGINAAGGSSNGTDPGQGGNDGFNPGGRPGGPGQNNNSSSSTSDYNIYIYGGNIYVNCTGDGIDSNGGLYLYGGTATVFSQATGGDNSPLDSDGTCIIENATVFAAGTNPMNENPTINNTAYLKQTTSRSANTVVDISSGGSVVYSTQLLRNINYLLYTNPSGTSFTLSTGSSVNSCKSDDWAHNWNSGEITTAATTETDGVKTYTCSSCGATETEMVKYYNASDYACDGHTSETIDEGYAVTFDVDEGASINIYYTSSESYTVADETNVTSTVSRNSETGEPDSTGSGQINFTVVLESGYSLSDITVTGSYNKIKDPSETGVENTYRITKVTSDLTVTVTTVKCTHSNVSNPVWDWSSDYSSATLRLDCADCGETVDFNATVTSTLGSDGKTITFKAAYTLNGTEYTDTKTAQAYTATFVTDDNATVNVYYTQNYTSVDEINASAAVARDSDNGNPVISGDGQVNFTIVVADGYELDGEPTIEGTYKNLKDVSADALVNNTYRITKIQSDLTVTIAVKKSESETTSSDTTTSSNT
ncbi:MAG: carbohydrate-binding domain-containing protein, partial [Acutalibacteraceae bacterium]